MGGPENHRKCMCVTPKLGLSWRFRCVPDTLSLQTKQVGWNHEKIWSNNKQVVIYKWVTVYILGAVVNVSDGS